MNIYTVRDNLKRTIAGKEKYLAEWEAVKASADPMMHQTIIGMLKINIDELKRILADVEQCVAKDVEQSWRDNPDRMGGQFTEDEINNAGRWV